MVVFHCGICQSAIFCAAKQPKHFLSFGFCLSAGGQGGAAQKCKEMFGGCPRELASAAEALPAEAERTIRPQATSHAARAKWVRAWVSISSQKETSAGVSAAEPRREAAREWAAANCALRARANSEGGQNETEIVLSSQSFESKIYL